MTERPRPAPQFFRKSLSMAGVCKVKPAAFFVILSSKIALNRLLMTALQESSQKLVRSIFADNIF